VKVFWVKKLHSKRVNIHSYTGAGESLKLKGKDWRKTCAIRKNLKGRMLQLRCG
jgi:hypothetical protein